ncbi:CHAT domain-containing protein [[Eubacterium] cellulosolvens]
MVKGKHSKIQEYSDTIDQMIQQGIEKRNKATKCIESAKTSIEEAEKIGLNTARANSLLKNAQNLLSSAKEFKEFDEAIKVTENIINMMTLLKSQYNQANQSITFAKKSLTALETEGIDPSQAKKLIQDAEIAIKNCQYASAKELANKSINLLNIQKQDLIKASQKPAPPKPTVSEIEPKTEPRPVSPSLHVEPSQGKPYLTLEYPDVGAFKAGAWGKLELNISNEGERSAKDIELKLSEEIESRGLKAVKILKPGENKIIRIGIRTNEIGEIPISIIVTYVDPKTNDILEFDEDVWIRTERGDFGADIGIERPAPERSAIPKAEGEVRVLSEVEAFQGFVRLKVGVKNEMNTVITDAKFDIEYDENAMRLDNIEPMLERKGNKVILGVIHPQEKRTIAFYLDPLICTESHVDGTLVFKDIYGELKTTAMKRRKAEVVCPILYTPENINTAMLKRMINEELTIHDSKIYEIPSNLDYERAMSICKDTIQAHDLKFVREFVEHDSDDPEIESWYYGTTKVKKHKVVIKASTRKKTNTIELFVACKDKLVITGFLAELGHNFNDKLKELGITKQPIFPVTDTETREEITQTNTLLQHQYSEKTTLSISKRGNEYEVSYKGSEEHEEASELCEFIKVSPDSRLDVIDQINDIVTVLNIFTCTRSIDGPDKEKVLKKAGIEDSADGSLIENKIRDLSSLGQLIYTMFLPVPIQKHLETVKEPIILKTNDNEIPWELLHDDKDFLCLKVPIGRRLRSREIPRTNQASESKKIRMLFIANPTGDLEGAEEEVNYIIKHLDPSIEVDVLKGNQATNASVLSAFRSGKYDIIHYSGHAEFNLAQPDESALICTNHRKIYAQEIKRILGGKPFVFLNACGSGREKICEDGESYTGSDTEGLASSFILGGALSFIGSSWPLPDISAGILASEFYRIVLAGESVGVALHKARMHLKNERPEDINWMAFILYGDPTLKLTKRVVT